MADTAAIILAAGKSTRMRSEQPKVLHEVCGRPMLEYVLSACRLAGVDRILVVIGHGREQVKEAFSSNLDITWVEQVEQNGTGHAVSCCREPLKDFQGSIFIVAGDMPLIRRETVQQLFELRETTGDVLTMATTELDDPTGYGRIIRDHNGDLAGIVEHRDCTPEQLTIREVNPSYYCFHAQTLFESLATLAPSGNSGETYLTDVVGQLRDKGLGVSANIEVAPEDALGINTRLALSRVAQTMQDRIQLCLMESGVTIVDPDNAWIEADVTIGRDSIVFPFSFVGKGATIGENCRVGPFAYVAAGEAIPDGETIESSYYPGVGA